MTWSAHFESPEGAAISDYDAATAVIGDKEAYAFDIGVALGAADRLSPNSEDGAQKVSLSGWRSVSPEGKTASFSVVVTELTPAE